MRDELIKRMIAHHDLWAVELADMDSAEAEFHNNAVSELRTLSQQQGGAGVMEKMLGLVEAIDASMVESLLGEGSDIWKGNRGKLRNRLPENIGVALAKMRTLLASTPAPDHSAGVGAVSEIRLVAKRNLRGMIERGSTDKYLMLKCLEELS